MRIWRYTLADGLFRVLLAAAAMELVSSVWAAGWALELHLMPVAVGTLAYLGVSLLLARRVQRYAGSRQLRWWAESAGFAMLFAALRFAQMITAPFRVLPAAEANAGDGLWWLLLTGAYFLATGLGRLGILAAWRGGTD